MKKILFFLCHLKVPQTVSFYLKHCYIPSISPMPYTSNSTAEYVSIQSWYGWSGTWVMCFWISCPKNAYNRMQGVIAAIILALLIPNSLLPVAANCRKSQYATVAMFGSKLFWSVTSNACNQTTTNWSYSVTRTPQEGNDLINYYVIWKYNNQIQ